MECNCKTCQLILGIVILVFAFWWRDWSQWIIAIAAVILILHALLCKRCDMCTPIGKAFVGKAAKKKNYYSKKSRRG